jgi:hypothetical protein
LLAVLLLLVVHLLVYQLQIHLVLLPVLLVDQRSLLLLLLLVVVDQIHQIHLLLLLVLLLVVDRRALLRIPVISQKWNPVWVMSCQLHMTERNELSLPRARWSAR